MVTDDDLSDVIFTSGTTGRPKGVMATHGQSVGVFRDWCSIVGLHEGDRYLMINPYFHTFGLKAGLIASFLRGATMLPVAVFDIGEVVKLIEAERITMLPGPPTVFQTIINHPDLKATHTFGDDRKVRPRLGSGALGGSPFVENTLRYTFPAHSLTILKLGIR